MYCFKHNLTPTPIPFTETEDYKATLQALDKAIQEHQTRSLDYTKDAPFNLGQSDLVEAERLAKQQNLEEANAKLKTAKAHFEQSRKNAQTAW